MTADKPLPLSEDALLRRLRLIATDDRRTYGLQGVSDDYDGLPLDDSDIARECAAAADLIERLAAELATARGMAVPKLVKLPLPEWDDDSEPLL